MNPITKKEPLIEPPISVKEAATSFRDRRSIVGYHTANDTAILVRHRSGYGFMYLNAANVNCGNFKHSAGSPEKAIDSALKFISSRSDLKSHSLGSYKNLTDLASTILKK